jgi:hypothetical protein
MARSSKRLALLPVLVGAVLAATTMTTPAVAQQRNRPAAEVRINPPTPKKADKPPTVWSYLVLIIILAAIVTANVIPSKRGHQD